MADHSDENAVNTIFPFRPCQPFMVVSVDPTIMDGHNGIFSEPFMDFLLRYIGFVEAKRFLLTQQRTPKAQQANAVTQHPIGGIESYFGTPSSP